MRRHQPRSTSLPKSKMNENGKCEAQSAGSSPRRWPSVGRETKRAIHQIIDWSSLKLQIIHLVMAACDEQVALLLHPVPTDGSDLFRVLFQFEWLCPVFVPNDNRPIPQPSSQFAPINLQTKFSSLSNIWTTWVLVPHLPVDAFNPRTCRSL